MQYTSKFSGEEIDSILDNVGGKQDAIPDLETIRSNAQNASDTIARMVESGYLFAGIATIDTNPSTHDAKVFYIANGKGTYEKFGGIKVMEDDVVVLYYDTAWHKVSTGIASQAKLTELERQLERQINGQAEEYSGTFTCVQNTALGRYDRFFLCDIQPNIYVDVLLSDEIGAISENSNVTLWFRDENNSWIGNGFNIKPNVKSTIQLPKRALNFSLSSTSLVIVGSGNVTLSLSAKEEEGLIGKIEQIRSSIPNVENEKLMLGVALSLLSNDNPGKFRGVTGSLVTNVEWTYTNPIQVAKGDIVVTKTDIRSATAVSFISEVDANGTYKKTLLAGKDGANSYYFIVPNDCYISISSVIADLNGVVILNSQFTRNILNIGNGENANDTFYKTMTITGGTLSDSVACGFLDSPSKMVSGNGNATITLSFPNTTARCLSIALWLPYAFQDVASIQVEDTTIGMAQADSRTKSGKRYIMEGDHFHRFNFDASAGISSVTLTITSSSAWSFAVATKAMFNDDMKVTPICVGYDIADCDYSATFPYQGENISIYELHRRLNVPYYVAIPKTRYISGLNQQIQDAIASGLCEVVFYSGSTLTSSWKENDFASKIKADADYIGIGSKMFIASQHVMDRHIFNAVKNADMEVLRCGGIINERVSRTSQKYGDNDIFYCTTAPMGLYYYKPLAFPQIWFGHGIGTPTDPNDPYIGNYDDPTGGGSISLLTNWKSMEENGTAIVLKPSDWVAYCKSH